MVKLRGVSVPCTLGVGACLMLLLASGCAATGARDDIKQIVQYWRPLPWLYDADSRPVGFRTTVYFVSGETDRGTFVPGKILFWLYTLEPGQDGRTEKNCAYMWELEQKESELYRVRKKSIQGYYYGFPLLWGPEVDVIGRPVEIVIGYERTDGRMIVAPGRRFHVPVPPGYRQPTVEKSRTEPPRPDGKLSEDEEPGAPSPRATQPGRTR